MIDMVGGYACFANEGYKVKPHFIRKVLDSKGNVIYEYNNVKEGVLNRSIVFILNELMTSTYDTAFIDYNYPTIISLLPDMTHKYAVKTGTTDTDVWIIGYNKNVVLGVWNGFDDNRVMSKEDSGKHKKIWVETIENYLKDTDKNTEWYDIPSNVVGVLVNPITGEPVNEASKKSKIFYFIKGTEPYYSSVDLDTVFKQENNQEN